MMHLPYTSSLNTRHMSPCKDTYTNAAAPTAKSPVVTEPFLPTV